MLLPKTTPGLCFSPSRGSFGNPGVGISLDWWQHVVVLTTARPALLEHNTRPMCFFACFEEKQNKFILSHFKAGSLRKSPFCTFFECPYCNCNHSCKLAGCSLSLDREQSYSIIFYLWVEQNNNESCTCKSTMYIERMASPQLTTMHSTQPIIQ